MFAVLTAFLGMLGTVCAWGLGGLPQHLGPRLSGVETGSHGGAGGRDAAFITPVHSGRGGTVIILLGTCPATEN